MEKKRNLYLLPTDKPSRLYYNVGGALLFTSYENHNAVNIYITSDEEIKDDEWHLHYYEGKPVISKSHNGASEYINLKAKEFGYEKIILTTDQDLIADGVQAIDDEFLEWFVKNPSCEWVEIKMENYYASGALQPNLWQYKIIIPKEEPKQETLEEAAENYSWRCSKVREPRFIALDGFVKGANWQAEKMYSEEEVEQIARFGFNAGRRVELKAVDLDFTFEKWFEQFKK